MKIKHEGKNERKLNEIKCAECFNFCNTLYIKSSCIEDNYVECMNLSIGCISSIPLDADVVQVNAEVFIHD